MAHIVLGDGSKRSAIVTGSSSGIGLAVVQMLHEEGYAVTMVARRSEKLSAAEQLVSSVPGPPVHALAGSVAEEAFLDEVVDFHTATYGAVDLLMNNAGIASRTPVAEITADLLDEQYAVNTRAVILLTGKSLPLLQAAVAQRGTAQVVNTSSNAGKRGEANLSSYSATKAAVLGFTEALHQELSTSGIKATAICPGLVDTPMADDTRDVVSPSEMIAPRDIAEAVRMTTRLSASCTVPEIIMLRPTDWLLPPDA
jgi:NAD(P)-dependent dehydrogenase (short-subunit alcohol dehydrogenase family)